MICRKRVGDPARTSPTVHRQQRPIGLHARDGQPVHRERPTGPGSIQSPDGFPPARGASARSFQQQQGCLNDLTNATGLGGRGPSVHLLEPCSMPPALVFRHAHEVDQAGIGHGLRQPAVAPPAVHVQHLDPLRAAARGERRGGLVVVPAQTLDVGLQMPVLAVQPLPVAGMAPPVMHFPGTDKRLVDLPQIRQCLLQGARVLGSGAVRLRGQCPNVHVDADGRAWSLQEFGLSEVHRKEDKPAVRFPVDDHFGNHAVEPQCPLHPHPDDTRQVHPATVCRQPIDGRRIAPFVLGPVGVGRKGLVYMAGSTFLLAVLSPTLSSTASNYKDCPAATRRFAAVIGGGIFSPQSPSDGCCACTCPRAKPAPRHCRAGG